MVAATVTPAAAHPPAGAVKRLFHNPQPSTSPLSPKRRRELSLQQHGTAAALEAGAASAASSHASNHAWLAPGPSIEAVSMHAAAGRATGPHSRAGGSAAHSASVSVRASIDSATSKWSSHVGSSVVGSQAGDAGRARHSRDDLALILKKAHAQRPRCGLA